MLAAPLGPTVGHRSFCGGRSHPVLAVSVDDAALCLGSGTSASHGTKIGLGISAPYLRIVIRESRAGNPEAVPGYQLVRYRGSWSTMAMIAVVAPW